MAVRKKTKVFFLTPTKKLKLRIACGLEKDVPGSEKREAAEKALRSRKLRKDVLEFAKRSAVRWKMFRIRSQGKDCSKQCTEVAKTVLLT